MLLSWSTCHGQLATILFAMLLNDALLHSIAAADDLGSSIAAESSLIHWLGVCVPAPGQPMAAGILSSQTLST